nr:MAG TPA: hypothetical protein [Caudoviricetes sp.]
MPSTLRYLPYPLSLRSWVLTGNEQPSSTHN